MNTAEERDGVREAFRNLYLADKEKGEAKEVSHYKNLFPGFWDVVDEEFGGMVPPAGAGAGPTVHGEAIPPSNIVVAPSPGSSSPKYGTVGPYRLVKELGRGGMGVVYLAEDVRIKRRVALKVLSPQFSSSAHLLLRFRREAEVASRIDHPGICAVYDADVDGEVPYIAMRLVDGQTLQQWIAVSKSPTGEVSAGSEPRTMTLLPGGATQAGPTAESGASVPSGARSHAEVLRVLLLMEKAARALHVAHEAGLIHRDIKPGNIMVTGEGEPVLLDFGLARADDEEGHRLTQTGSLMGTPAYMSPEQLTAQRIALDRRTDVYSLGATLYECLTLRLPFEAPTLDALYQKILATDPDDARKINPAIPDDLRVVVETAMEKDRDRRYRTALDLAEDLRRVREYEPIRARAPGPLLRLRRWSQRNPVGTMLLLVLVVAGSVSTIQWRRTRAALRKARVLGLVDASAAARSVDQMRSLLLARAALRMDPIPEAISGLREALMVTRERVVFRGHKGGVNSVAFSPAGDRVLTSSSDGTARVWDLEGREILVLGGDMGRVCSAVFSPSGERILTWTSGGDAQLWNLQGRRIAEFLSPSDSSLLPWLEAFASFSPDGSMVLTPCKGGNARLWDLTGRELALFRGHKGRLNSAVFSPKGERILTASGDGTARLWDLKGREHLVVGGDLGDVIKAVFSPNGECILTSIGLTSSGTTQERPPRDWSPRLWDLQGKEVATFPNAGPSSCTAEFTAAGDRVLTASLDGTAKVWDLKGRELMAFRGHTMGITMAALHPDGQTVLTTSNDRTLRLWDNLGRQTDVLLGHEGWVRSAVFSPNGDSVLSASWDGTARLWTLQASEPRAWRDPSGGARYIAFSAAGDRVLTGSKDNRARLWDLEGRLLASFKGHSEEVLGAVFSPEGRRVLTASADKTARLWDLQGRELAVLKGHEGSVGFAAFSPSGDRIVTASEDKTARLWDLQGTEIATFRFHGRAHSAVISPDGDRVLTSSGDQTVRLWDLKGNLLWMSAIDTLEPRNWSGPSPPASFSPDGDRILITCQYNKARLLDLDGNEIANFDHGFTSLEDILSTAVFSPSGDQVLTASHDKSVRLWDLKGRQVAVFLGHEGPVLSAMFSTSGDLVLTHGADRTARLWEPSGRELGVLRPGDSWWGTSVALSNTGARVASVSDDGTIRIWRTHADDLLRLAEECISRELNPGERSRYDHLLDE